MPIQSSNPYMSNEMSSVPFLYAEDGTAAFKKLVWVAAQQRAREMLDKYLSNHKLDSEKTEKLFKLLVNKLSNECYDMAIDDGRFGLDETLSKAASLANDLDKRELYREADAIDFLITPALKESTTPALAPQEGALTLTRLIHHLMQRSKIENRNKFIESIKEHLAMLNPLEISRKKNNPSSAIGAAINIIKNVLQAQPATVISSILGQLFRML